MFSKIGICNTALALTGNNLVAVAEDGSDEWNVASAAYEAGVLYLIGEHDWKFGTAIATLTRTGDSTDENYEDAYAKPANSLGLIWVKLNNLPVDWKVVGNSVLLTDDDGTVKAKYVLEPDPEEWPPLFVKALDALVRAGLFSGLNEDEATARQWRAEAEAYLARARARSDREGMRKQVFHSKILARRNRRLVTR